ncbi:MAG: hypothetical protein ACRC9P_09535 [Bacteroides sp.]
MIYDLKNPYDIGKFKDRVVELINQRAVVDLTKKNPNRSLSQNAYLHLILGFFAVEYGCSLDEVKLDFFKRKCNKEIFERRVINKQGKEITTLRSSADLDTMEMTTAIERFRNWSVSVAGIYLPSPDEDQFLIHVSQEIERNKAYI